ncbi:MAG: transposase [Polyangiales bacterium]|jgi:transposase
MNDVQLYQAILGIAAPWHVSEVKLALDDGGVDVHVEHERGERFGCPECGVLCPVYDHVAARRWRHLDTCQYQTLLHAKPPRVKCEAHGVRQASLPWAEKKSQFTLLFERFAIDVLLVTDVASAARVLRISWDEAWSIQKRAVRRGQKRREECPRVVTKVGVDEKSPGRSAEYFTIVSDLDSKSVAWIGDGRFGAVLDEYWNELTEQDLDGIEVIAMDMGAAYYASAIRSVPDGIKKVVFDRFHVMQHATKAVDRVRRSENLSLIRNGEGPSPLAQTRHLWLYSEENLPEHQQDRFYELKTSELRTAKAWGMKELLRKLWSFTNKPAAGRFLSRFTRSANAMRLQPLKRLAKMLSAKRKNILTYIDHHVTSATCEGLNSAIQALKTRGRGYRNRDNFKTAIYFRRGALDLYPPLPN